MALTAESYLWEHWKFNADQRLKDFERDLPLTCRPFLLDERHRQTWLRYTVAFNMLFALQLLFGLLVSGFGMVMGYRGVTTW